MSFIINKEKIFDFLKIFNFRFEIIKLFNVNVFILSTGVKHKCGISLKVYLNSY